jgi:peptidoglycan/LPS O-acetylase OafA/YrhL
MIVHGNQPRGMPEGIYARYLADIVPAFGFATLMLATALAPPRGQWLMANRLARWLGDVSYGAFLWHFPLILLFVRTLGWVQGRGDAPFFTLVALVVPCAFLCGWLSRRLLEEPAIRWAKRGRSSDARSGREGV